MASTTKSPPAVSVNTRGVVVVSLCIVAGAYGLHGIGWTGGMIHMLQSIIHDPASNFPNSETLLRRRFTGIAPLDVLLMNLGPFFGPVVDRSWPPLTIFSFFMFGQFGVGWSLMVLESLRGANKGLALSFIGVFGLLIQTGGYALISPIWFLLYITTSPLAKSPARSQSTTSLRVPLSSLAALPVSLVIGYIFPSLLVMLPSPSIVSIDTRQKLIAAWQPFPIYTIILMGIFSTFISPTTTASPGVSATYLSTANKVYTFIISFAVITNLLALLVTILPADIISTVSPAIASSITNSPVPISFFTIYLPRPLLPSWKAVNLADAVHTFLHVDTYASAFAALAWALILRSRTITDKQISGIDLRFMVRLLVWIMLAGPFGAIAVLMWEREGWLAEMEKAKGGI
ncbi:hypothetical protein F5884DRAFT_779934 [Xylogone sp. PMI_703]|nr:hypothetical protein F5884DRAFT_779934 [Xylogone sp. PMI_703]